MEEKEVTTGEILEAVNRSFSAIQERFDAVDGRFDRLESDLQSFKFETAVNFNNLESDLKSFKLETEDNFATVNEKLDDLYDTDRGFDRRVSVLEQRLPA